MKHNFLGVRAPPWPSRWALGSAQALRADHAHSQLLSLAPYVSSCLTSRKIQMGIRKGRERKGKVAFRDASGGCLPSQRAQFLSQELSPQAIPPFTLRLNLGSFELLLPAQWRCTVLSGGLTTYPQLFCIGPHNIYLETTHLQSVQSVSGQDPD